MEAGGRSGYRSALLSINSLIAVAVAGRIGARYVRRKRNMADAIENPVKIIDRLEADAALAEFGAGENFGLEFSVTPEQQAFAASHLAPGSAQRLPLVRHRRWLARP